MKFYEINLIQIIYFFLLIKIINNAGGNPSTIPITSTIPSTESEIDITDLTTTISTKESETDKITNSDLIPIIEPINPLSSLSEGNNDINESERCWDTEPTKDIIDDCIKGNNLPNDKEKETCCYMTIKYKYSNLYGCIPILKDAKIIKERIKELKVIYSESKSIKINCNKTFIKLNLMSILLFLMNFFD